MRTANRTIPESEPKPAVMNKINYVCSLVQGKYFVLTPDLKISKPLIF